MKLARSSPWAQQVGQPFAVSHVGLAPRHCFYVTRIDQHDFENAFQDVEHRLPIHAGALDGYLLAAFRYQPIGKSKQIIGHRRARANLFLAVLDETDDHGLSVHVYATAAAVNDVHRSSLPSVSEH